MYKGWSIPFAVNRPLTGREREDALPRKSETKIRPEERGSLISMNSTYLDWIDRRFFYRGTMNTFFVTLSMFFFIPVLVFINLEVYRLRDNEEYWWAYLFLFVPTYIMIWYMVKVNLRQEYFAYTHWPIRFNRKTQMVHVFRHNGQGGTLSVPWDQVYFHIGTGGNQRPDSIYICGHILDGDIVKDTFALGHDVPKDRKQNLLEMWKFLCLYMEKGPEAAGPHPLDRYVGLSVKPTLKSCWIMMSIYYLGALPLIARILAYPFVLLYTATRWVVLHTCREPVFPPEVEATCQIEPDDPNIWPIPSYCWEFAETVPGMYEYGEAKHLAREAERRKSRK